MKLVEDLGMLYPNLTSKNKRRYGLYKCFCGNEFMAQIANVKNRNTKSCGCINGIKHNLTNHRLYQTWKNMMSRCYLKKNPNYQYYGAIGITVCDEWHNIENFINDMYPTFKEGLSIDKDIMCKKLNINPHIYSKQTCIWTTKSIQTRVTKKIHSHNTSEYRGVSFFKKIKRYSAQIKVNGKSIKLGVYDTAFEAAKVRDKYVIDNNLEHTLNILPTEHTLEPVKKVIEIYEEIK